MDRIILRVRSDHGDCNLPKPAGATRDEDRAAAANGDGDVTSAYKWRGVTLYLHSTHVPHCTIARL